MENLPLGYQEMENFASWASRNEKFGLCFSFQFGEMSELGC
jgi:hypothetical protein